MACIPGKLQNHAAHTEAEAGSTMGKAGPSVLDRDQIITSARYDSIAISATMDVIGKAYLFHRGVRTTQEPFLPPFGSSSGPMLGRSARRAPPSCNSTHVNSYAGNICENSTALRML